jgi:hypothetical protein
MQMGGPEASGFRGAGLRWGQLLALLGLTGFAISQPLLAVAADNPSMFTFAGVRGWSLLALVLVIAVVPPLVLWVGVVAIGSLHRRAGDVVFLASAAALVALVTVQWVKLAGIERRTLVAASALVAAGAFTWALVRLPTVATFTRYTAALPAVALASFVLSPAGDLLRGSQQALGEPSDEDVAPVVFIMLDELPTRSILDGDQNVDAVRFPRLAEFAEDATWYRDFTTVASKTLQAVPSMLTGREPTDDNSGLWTNHPDNLFDLLAPTHDLEVSETVTQLCGFSTCNLTGAGSGSGLSGALREMGEVWRQRVSLGPISPPDLGQFREEAEPLAIDDRREDDESFLDPDVVRARPDRATDFLESLAQASGASLHYLHLMLPHQPWILYPDGTPFDTVDAFTDAELPPVLVPDWGLVTMEQRHLLQAQYTDRLLGEIFDVLRTTGRYDESLVVVTADHGIAFQTWPQMRNLDPDVPETLSSIAYVPLFVKEPGQTEGRTADTNLMGPDLLPTMADILGVEPAGEVDGLAATDPRIAERGDRKHIYDLGSGFAAEFQGILEFDAGYRPTAEGRWTGNIDSADHPLGGLFTHLGVDEYLGADPAALPVVKGGRARTAALEAIEATTGETALGYLHGHIDDEPDEGTLLVAFDGEIVSAAPVGGGAFQTVLPPPDDEGSRGEPEMLHLVDGELRQLEIVDLR